jgi:two-component system, LuxR family, response regulator FixJ
MTLIYIVDDDEAVRDSISVLMESAGYEVEVFELAWAALDRCRMRLPDCILSDVRMPGMDGIEFQEKLTENGIDVPVVIMTGHGDVRLAVRAMKAGALDFIEKPFDDHTVLASIKEATTRNAARQMPRPLDAEVAARLETLTPREREVLDLLVAGDPNKVIAYRLQISPRTVEIHRARVMEKMRAKSLPALVRMAMTLGAAGPR